MAVLLAGQLLAGQRLVHVVERARLEGVRSLVVEVAHGASLRTEMVVVVVGRVPRDPVARGALTTGRVVCRRQTIVSVALPLLVVD